MAKSGKSKLVTSAIKYAPFVIEGVRRYGPAVREQLVQNKGALGEVVSGHGRRGETRRNALAHAAAVIDGSAMQCFYQAQEYWVVFSGETPIGVHPFTSIPYGELLRHADLARRVRPTDPAARGVLGRIAGRVRPAPKHGAPQPFRPQGTPQPPPGAASHGEPVEGEII